MEHFNLVNIGGSKQGWRDVWGRIKMTTFGLVPLWKEVWRHSTSFGSEAALLLIGVVKGMVLGLTGLRRSRRVIAYHHFTLKNKTLMPFLSGMGKYFLILLYA